MGEDKLMIIRKNLCNHFQQRQYKQKRLDILNGFELVLTRCINCHKVLNLEAKRIKKSQSKTNIDNKWLTKLLNSFKNLFRVTMKMIKNLHFQIKKHV
jgi:hypothetical protein